MPVHEKYVGFIPRANNWVPFLARINQSTAFEMLDMNYS